MTCDCLRSDRDCEKCKEGYRDFLRVSQDSIVSDVLDSYCDKPYKLKLEYPKELTKSQRKVLRTAFNHIQPELTRLVEEEMHKGVAIDEGKKFLKDLKKSEKSTAKSKLNFP